MFTSSLGVTDHYFSSLSVDPSFPDRTFSNTSEISCCMLDCKGEEMAGCLAVIKEFNVSILASPTSLFFCYFSNDYFQKIKLAKQHGQQINTGNTEVKALKAALTHPHYTRCVTSPKNQLIIQNVCEQCGCVTVTIVISFSFPDHSLASPHACLRENVLLPSLMPL